MNLFEFEAIVDRHSLFPGNDIYNSNALAGEVGEICNINKKIEIFKQSPNLIADTLLTPEYFRECEVDELGDILFYLVRKIKDNGVSIETVMQLQAEKLEKQSVKYNRIFKK